MKKLWKHISESTFPGTRLRLVFIVYACALAGLLVGLFAQWPLWVYAVTGTVGVIGAVANWSDPEPAKVAEQQKRQPCSDKDCWRCSEL